MTPASCKHRARPARSTVAATLALAAISLVPGGRDGLAAAAPANAKPKSPLAAVALRYAEAVAKGDRTAVGQLDFACQYRMLAANPKGLKKFPPESDPIYAQCWAALAEAHQSAVDRRDLGMDVLWPGQGALVFFGEELTQYPPSAFVMDRLGQSPPGGGLRLAPVDAGPLPAVSFRLRDEDRMTAVPAMLVRLRVAYNDPLTSPVTYAQGTYRWTSAVRRPRQALKAVTVGWVVLSNLKKLGFPSDHAVLNLPVTPATDQSPAVPFSTEYGGYVRDSAEWWGPADSPGLLIAAVGRAAQFPELRERVAMLNRVLIIDPDQHDALTALSRDLFNALLAAGARAHQVALGDPALAARFNELYWDTYAHTTRVDISLDMEIGGFAKPTPADYLYRMVPAMERLARINPEDLENRLRLGVAYRWLNDQQNAIGTHEALVKSVPAERAPFRARALIELAWSKIAKVAWNRIFDDPAIKEAYRDAEEAFKLTDRPQDKFAAAYTMAYSQAFMPDRNNRLMLEHLTEAQKWYLQLTGASLDSWRFLLANDTLKGVIESDPAFKPLLAAS
ncbi:tetratricopeptide repeat protein [Nitrospira sp. Kam-Ns4a]